MVEETVSWNVLNNYVDEYVRVEAEQYAAACRAGVITTDLVSEYTIIWEGFRSFFKEHFGGHITSRAFAIGWFKQYISRLPTYTTPFGTFHKSTNPFVFPR